MLRNFFIGAAGLLAFGAAPIVPADMELLVSYQYPASEYQQFIRTGFGTSSEAVPNPQPRYIDDDGNGQISVSVFADKKGNAVFVQIDEARYADMGGKTEEGKGSARNPTKTEFMSVLEAFTPAVSAAVALDVATTGTGTGTSITYAHTVTGSEPILYVSTNVNETATGDLITGVTYNAVSMNLVGKIADSTSYFAYLFVLPAPTTGANNVVISRSVSGGIVGTSVSYTGACQVTAQNSTTGTANASSINMTLTTVASNSWVIAGASRHRGWTAGANTTLRTPEGLYNMSTADSGGLAGGSGTPGSKTLAVTQADATASSWAISEIKESVACPVGGPWIFEF